MLSYRKINLLCDIWQNPKNYEPTQTQKMVLENLETFIERVQAYNGKIVCGDHGIGKTFTVRHLLSKLGCLDDVHYINVNKSILETVKRENISMRQKNKIFKIVKSLIRSVEPVLVLDGCEILSFLNSAQCMEFMRNVHYQRTKTLLVLPTELNPGIPSITINFPNPSTEEYEIFFRNMRMKTETPSFSIPFSRLLSRVT